MTTFHRVTGKNISPMEDDWLNNLEPAGILIDIGTGDGRFIIDTARENPDWLCIGVDAAAENMHKNSRSAAAKPKKGGLPNALFVRGAAENLPGPFAGLADRVTVNYPWGSLMRIVSAPDVDRLALIRRICRTGADLTILLNYYVFEDREYLARLGMEDIIAPADNPDLPELYRQSGFEIRHSEIFAGDPPVRTMWGRHLVRGSSRTTMLVEAVAV